MALYFDQNYFTVFQSILAVLQCNYNSTVTVTNSIDIDTHSWLQYSKIILIKI